MHGDEKEGSKKRTPDDNDGEPFIVCFTPLTPFSSLTFSEFFHLVSATAFYTGLAAITMATFTLPPPSTSLKIRVYYRVLKMLIVILFHRKINK